MVAIYNPAVSGTYGMREVGFWFAGMLFFEDLIDVSSLIGAVFGDFPFVPDFDAAVLEPANIV